MTEPWWSGGVNFSCIGCGRCCRGEPGAIFFTPDEGERVRNFIGVDEPVWEREYVTLKWSSRKPSFTERRNGDCVFYDAKTAKCSIYHIRPLQCALFPFWVSVMKSAREWDKEALRCPGMNEGRRYSADEIRAFLTMDPFGDY